MQNWVYGTHNDVGREGHPRHMVEQRLGMLRQAQSPGATKTMSEGFRRTHVGLLIHAKYSLKKLVEIHCP